MGKKEKVRNGKGKGRFLYNYTEKDQDLLCGLLSWTSFLGIWLGGLAIPFVSLALLAKGQIVFGIVGFVIAIYVYFDKYNPLIKKNFEFYARGIPSYFKSVSVFCESEIDPKSPTVFAVHPHGIFCAGWSLLTCMKEFNHVFFCVATALYHSGFKFLARSVCNLAPCDPISMKALMAQGRSIAVLPGGFNEASLHSSAIDRVYIKKRKGFVAYALRFAADLSTTLDLSFSIVGTDFRSLQSTRSVSDEHSIISR
jgi:hypothetical protein